MNDIAKVFKTGRSQAVRLPAAYRFDTQEVFVRRDAATGDVILSKRPDDWEALLQAAAALDDDAMDFLNDRSQGAPQRREPL